MAKLSRDFNLWTPIGEPTAAWSGRACPGCRDAWPSARSAPRSCPASCAARTGAAPPPPSAASSSTLGPAKQQFFNNSHLFEFLFNKMQVYDERTKSVSTYIKKIYEERSRKIRN